MSFSNGSGNREDDMDWYFKNYTPTFNRRTNPGVRYVPRYPTTYTECDGLINPDGAQPEHDEFLFSRGLMLDPMHVPFEHQVNIAKTVKTRKANHKVSNSAPKAYSSSALYPKATPIIDEYEEADFGDTYDDYKPAKLDFGQKHPDSVVESSSLSVVIPPDITYKLKMPKEVIENGALSSLQLESVVYACQKHHDFLTNRQRAGYLIGDGPGVGKGRIISGIIYENMLNCRTKALWLSVSSDLKYDAESDLEDIGCHVHVVSLHKLSYGEKIEEIFEGYNDIGVLFSTYSSLIGESHSQDSHYRSRYDQVLEWLTPQFDGVIVFDECHKAKNLKPTGATKPTKTAMFVLKLQNDLPNARIVYCSATGASEPRNMAYMIRLGLWGVGTPFTDFEAFLCAVEKRGIGAMELIAIDMKQRGVYLARQLSFAGVTFKVKEILLSQGFKQIYNDCVRFWDKALTYFERAADILCYCSRERTFLMAHFYAAHQRFFKGLCIASKVPEVVEIVKEAIHNNKAVVIGLQSTGEAVSAQLVKQSKFPKIVSTSYGILVNLIKKQFPTPDKKSSTMNNKDAENYDYTPPIFNDDSFLKVSPLKRKRPSIEPVVVDTLLNASLQCNRSNWRSNEIGIPATKDNKYCNSGPKQECQKMIDELLCDIENLNSDLPPNTLDQLIDLLGGPSCVAEMTGRKGRIVKSSEGVYIFESRGNEQTSLELVNVHERDNFMTGNKLIAIISEAASSGISLQSDRRVSNTRQRLHITLELSWSADRAVQQFGRTHRSNQLTPPEYLFIISELAGEKRFACVVAKRLESLGALTHGDRRATDTRDLSQFNIDTKYGRYALDKMIEILNGRTSPCCDLPKYPGDFLIDAKNISSRLFHGEFGKATLDSKGEASPKIHKFLNRLLGVEVDLQNAIYEFYTSILDFHVKDAQLSGKFDFGIIDYGLGSEIVVESSKTRYDLRSSSGATTVEMIGFSVERGITFEQANSLLRDTNDPNIGFYMSKEAVNGRYRRVMLILKSLNAKNPEKVYTCSRPNTGFGTKTDIIENLTKNYYKVDPHNIKEDWIRFYETTGTMCVHSYFSGTCKAKERTGNCDVGRRGRSINLLCGAIFSIWNVIEETFGASPIRMARITTKDKVRRIGILVPTVYLDHLNSILSRSKAS